MKYSKSTGACYLVEIHGDNIPTDAIDIDDRLYESLLEWRANNIVIEHDENGFPIAGSLNKQTIDELRETMILSAADARLRLAEKGWLLRVLEVINQLQEDNALKIKWEYSITLHRTDPVLVDFCKQTLGMTDEQIDELFTL